MANVNRNLTPLCPDTLEFAPGLLALEARPPSPLPRAILHSLLLLCLCLLLWAVFGRLDIIAVAEGKLVPETYLKIVQPAESGIVREILIKEGDRVGAGQVLIRMDTAISKADSTILQTELTQRALQLRRIDAELTGKPLTQKHEDPPELFRQFEAQYQAHRQAYQDALSQEQAGLARIREELAAAQQVLKKLQATLPAYEAEEAAWAKLGQRYLAGRLQVLDKQRERIEREQDLRAQERTVQSLKATLMQTEKRLAQITSNYHQQLHNERVEAQAAFEKTQQEWAKQQHKHRLLELKAPQAGVIKELATHTVGAVVSPGTILMTLVPADERLQAEVAVENQDIGFIHEGQPAKIKLLAYPFQKYGWVEGVVTHVSADATESPRARAEGEPSQDRHQALLTYKAIVSLNTQGLEREGQRFALSPGMQVVAEIHQGQRTLLEYLLSPVQGMFHEAFRER